MYEFPLRQFFLRHLMKCFSKFCENDFGPLDQRLGKIVGENAMNHDKKKRQACTGNILWISNVPFATSFFFEIIPDSHISVVLCRNGHLLHSTVDGLGKHDWMTIRKGHDKCSEYAAKLWGGGKSEHKQKFK